MAIPDAEIIGAFAGTVVSLAFLPPKTRNGFFRRSIVAMICGPLAAPVFRDYVGWSSVWDYRIAAAAFTAFISWWAIGAGTSLTRAWLEKKSGLEDG